MVRRRAARTAAVHHTAARAHRRAHAARPRQPREVAAPHSELCGVRGCARPLGALLPDPLELFGSVCSQINDEEIAEAEAFEEEMAGALEGMPSPDPSTRSSSPSEDGLAEEYAKESSSVSCKRIFIAMRGGATGETNSSPTAAV